jgi:hypothetical protein
MFRVYRCVANVRAADFNHFTSHIKSVTFDRPGVDNFNFKTINAQERGELTIPFCDDEVKKVTWECDSFKGPGPDDINFGFIN